jgi:hypothetical protein
MASPRTIMVSRTKRRRFIVAVALGFVLPFGTIGTFWYRAFHEDGAWISRSPTHPSWAVDLMKGGFMDISLDFRVHDFAAHPGQPFYICDLYWEGLYSGSELDWSGDGTVAAIPIHFQGQYRPLYGAAYDFLHHQPWPPEAAGSALKPSRKLHAQVEQLLSSRGGVGNVIGIPDPTKPDDPR